MHDREKVLSDWFDENLLTINPGTDEIAHLILSKMLVEHSCCDTQTFRFCDELYEMINI